MKHWIFAKFRPNRLFLSPLLAKIAQFYSLNLSPSFFLCFFSNLDFFAFFFRAIIFLFQGSSVFTHSLCDHAPSAWCWDDPLRGDKQRRNWDKIETFQTKLPIFDRHMIFRRFFESFELFSKSFTKNGSNELDFYYPSDGLSNLLLKFEIRYVMISPTLNKISSKNTEKALSASSKWCREITRSAHARIANSALMNTHTEVTVSLHWGASYISEPK